MQKLEEENLQLKEENTQLKEALNKKNHLICIKWF